MEVELNNKSYHIRDITFREKMQYITKLKDIKNRVKDTGDEPLEELYDIRFELLERLSNKELTKDILYDLSAKQVDYILNSIDSDVASVEEIKKN